MDLQFSVEKTKLITLSQKKYVYTRVLANGTMPLRAIDQQYIRDKTEKINETEKSKDSKEIEGERNRILPRLIPLGPCIKTPEPVEKQLPCGLSQNNVGERCDAGKGDKVTNKLMCSAENLLLEMMLPEFRCPKVM